MSSVKYKEDIQVPNSKSLSFLYLKNLPICSPFLSLFEISAIRGDEIDVRHLHWILTLGTYAHVLRKEYSWVTLIVKNVCLYVYTWLWLDKHKH